MSSKRYLSAQEAAAELGISVSTLYAYVSRGLIRSEATEGKSRAKRYRREDVAALKARKELRRNPAKAAETALHWGAPILESQLTLIRDGRLYYRGHDVLTLPDRHSFEAVALLLWQGELTDSVTFERSDQPEMAGWALYREVAPLLDGLTPMEAFQVVLPLAAARDLAAYDLGETAVVQTGIRILRLLTIVATGRQPEAPLAQTLQRAWAPNDPRVASLLNAALIFCADHELNVSSFTARTVASAEATPHAVVIAGLAALQGRKHGGFTERVAAFLREVGTPDQAQPTVASRLKRGDLIPGFGHKLYPDGDPRCRDLLARITAVFPYSPVLELTQSVIDAVADSIGLHPTIDLALVTLAQAAGLPPGTPLALFALGRTAGWLGHAVEQYAGGQLIRPRAKYTGPLPAASTV